MLTVEFNKKNCLVTKKKKLTSNAMKLHFAMYKPFDLIIFLNQNILQNKSIYSFKNR